MSSFCSGKPERAPVLVTSRGAVPATKWPFRSRCGEDPGAGVGISLSEHLLHAKACHDVRLKGACVPGIHHGYVAIVLLIPVRTQ